MWNQKNSGLSPDSLQTVSASCPGVGHPSVPVFCFFLRAEAMAYGSSQIRGSNQSYSCQPMPQSQQHWILNPMSETKDRACILMDPSQVLNLLSPSVPIIEVERTVLLEQGEVGV